MTPEKRHRDFDHRIKTGYGVAVIITSPMTKGNVEKREIRTRHCVNHWQQRRGSSTPVCYCSPTQLCLGPPSCMRGWTLTRGFNAYSKLSTRSLTTFATTASETTTNGSSESLDSLRRKRKTEWKRQQKVNFKTNHARSLSCCWNHF